MFTELVPNEKRLVVEKTEEKQDLQTPGGLYVPEGSSLTKSKSRTGRIVAVPKSDSGCCGFTPRFSVGDKIVFDKHAGTDITVDGKEFLILHFDDVLVKIV